ncbi:hypothetical protein LEN26_006866 [Aphanomyces euteiches]|nr:hypothetical protein AeMF1_013808 [Aphanomyces euteiches]KAH9134147.1 hypothetical protein LEN26_006866 [Aphanomyces euteiches]KAH9186930.1 hypothetical protein AeNC1_011093 [Aphanomyces euteiches]
MIELDALLNKHKADIISLKEHLQDVLEPQYDDIWLLRFVLTNGNVQDAIEPCRYTIQWRNARKDLLDRVHAGEMPALHDQVTKFQVAGEHKLTKYGEPLFIVRIGLSNSKALMEALPFDDLLEYYMLIRERIFLHCDKLTRAIGSFVRMTILLDFQGFSITRGYDRQFAQLNEVTGRLSEKMYPQLLGHTVFLNTPSVVLWMIKLFKPRTSDQAAEGKLFCPGGSDISACPFVSSNLGLESLPTFIGGSCTCGNGRCIGNVPNSQTIPIDAVDANGLTSVTLAARTSQTIDLPVSKGTVVNYHLEAEGKPLSVTVALVAPPQDEQFFLERPMLQKSNGAFVGKWAIPQDGILQLRVANIHAFMSGRSFKYKLNLS